MADEDVCSKVKPNCSVINSELSPFDKHIFLNKMIIKLVT